MAINVFEGARRFAKVIACIAIFVSIFEIFGSFKEPSLRYIVSDYGAPPSHTMSSCKYPDEQHSVTRISRRGARYELSLCFIAQESVSGDMRIPADRFAGVTLLFDRYDDATKQYIVNVAAKFTPPSDDEKKLWLYTAADWVWHIVRGLGYLLIGLSVFSIVVSVIGWIARGFAGIPNGKDHRDAV